MSWEVLGLFQTAAQYYYRKYRAEGGTLDKLSQQLNITPTYLSAVINGSRVPSLELQCQIADILYGPYDKFIAVGRELEKGIDPREAEEMKRQETVETLIARLTHLVMDYKQLARKLEVSEKKFMDISLTTGDMIFEIDRDYTFRFAAGKVREVTGLSEKELLGRKLSDFLDGREWQRVKHLFDSAIAGRMIFDAVLEVQDGYRHCIAKPVFAEKDDRFQGFRGTYRDITIRKNLEKTLDKKMWLLQSAIDAVIDSGVVITDRSNRILHWNAAFEEYFDLPREIRKKAPAGDLFSHLEEKVAEVADFRRCIQEHMESAEECVHHFTLKNGRKIRRRTVPIYRDGTFAGRVFFLRETGYILDAQAI